MRASLTLACLVCLPGPSLAAQASAEDETARLVRHLVSADPEQAFVARERLVTLGPRAVAPLLDAVASERAEPGLRIEAARALGALGPKAADAAPRLMEMVQQVEPKLARALLDAVARTAPYAAPGDEIRASLEAIALAGSRSLPFIEVYRAISWLGAGPGQRVRDLTRMLADGNPFTREAAACALGHRGPEAARALPALGRALAAAHPHRITARIAGPGIVRGYQSRANWDDHIHLEAARAILAIDPRAAEAIAAHVHLLRASPSAAVRRRAAMALGRFGPAATSAVPALAASLDDPDVRVVREAVTSLGMLEGAARSAIPALEACLRRTDDKQVRARTEAALAHIRD